MVVLMNNKCKTQVISPFNTSLDSTTTNMTTHKNYSISTLNVALQEIATL